VAKWNADLDAVVAQPAFAELGWIKGHAAQGQFSASLGAATDVTGDMTITGHDAARSISLSGNLSMDDYKLVTFHLPVKIAIGSTTSEFTADGTSNKEKDAHRIDITIAGEKVAVEHLELLAGVLNLPIAGDLAAMARTSAMSEVPKLRDTAPFWGDLIGRVRVEFREVHSGSRELDEVAGTFDVGHDALRLNGGRAVFTPQDLTKLKRRKVEDVVIEPNAAISLEGAISYDPAAAADPYRLKASGGVDVIEGARLLGAAKAGQAPTVEGRWAVDVELTGRGANLPNLIAGRREEYHLTSMGGAFRLLKVNVAEAMPDAPTPGSDAAAKVGSTVGWLFGVNRDAFNTENHLNKQTEAVLNFTYETAELPYDKITVTAIREADQSIRLKDIFISSANVRLTGSGKVAFVEGQPFNARPLNLDLQLSVRGTPADRLRIAGLIGADKNADGFTALPQSIHFGGTLQQPDRSEWRDVLVKAATPKSKK
jgi:hypothetical protein